MLALTLTHANTLTLRVPPSAEGREITIELSDSESTDRARVVIAAMRDVLISREPRKTGTGSGRRRARVAP